MRRAAILVLAAVILAAPIASAAAVTPRASLTDIESQVMCTVCKTPLAVSQSAEANDERTFISGLIAKGETKAQILKAMVFQYGPAVLALPPAHGFNIALYVLPPAVLIIGAALLFYTLPRWRRRTRAATANATDPGLTAPAPQDSRRLEEDLARYGR
ncbi:MAG TPA: cytochrome c-type biogenesis protein CcmH [Solirubrobacteraceae bacterium]|jgi:cytochrome c-type biogenesis protein CcmH|nr:cytochrome c-type biogenesis protein CcmH [Solirubrobacteraceae bacterium]